MEWNEVHAFKAILHAFGRQKDAARTHNRNSARFFLPGILIHISIEPRERRLLMLLWRIYARASQWQIYTFDGIPISWWETRILLLERI